jgi:glyoxylase-like metal-dependent hydrolase (beta-lactamase superfamily II)
MKTTAQSNTSSFPRPFLLEEVENIQPIPDIYWVGHHNERSFGAVPYLLRARHHNHQDVWILIDTPRFSIASVRDVQSLTGENGPDYLFMTHIDDTADHEQWKERFPNLKQIFHAGDLGRNNWLRDKSLESVDILLQDVPSSHSPDDPLVMYDLDGKIVDRMDDVKGNVVILHTPGHSPGSITLYKLPDGNSPGVLFTGDTYAYTPYKKMTGFGRYGRNLAQQTKTLSKLLQLKGWDVIAPGHGHPRDYRKLDDSVKMAELKHAQEDLLAMSTNR